MSPRQCLEEGEREALFWVPFGHRRDRESSLTMDRDGGAPTIHVTLVGGWDGWGEELG